MKYVRTKDAIVDKSRLEFLGDGKVKVLCGKSSYILDDLEILKEADTIEKLFDIYLVHVESLNRVFTFYNIEKAKQEVIRWPLGTCLYGSIITFGTSGEPIVKAAAKMNEKGGFDLL